MEIDGYEARRNEDFIYGEDYDFYKDGEKVGWMRYHSGILRVSTDISVPFLYHELYGDEVLDEFATSKDRRKALRFAVKLLREHYGDKTNSLKTIATIFPGAMVTSQEAEQITMF